MKKGFYYILTVAVIAGILPGSVIAEAASEKPVFEAKALLEVDFDRNSSEFVFSTSDSSAQHACEIKNSEIPEMGNALSMKRESSSESGVFAEMNLGEAVIEGNSGKYLIEYDVLTSSVDQWAPYIILGAGDNHTKLSVMGADSSDVICSYAANPSSNAWWACYEHKPENMIVLYANSWMNVKIVLDTVNSAADYYYDGTYVGTQDSDKIGTAFDGGIDKLRFELWSHSDFQPEIMIDNIKVSRILPTIGNVEIVDFSGERKPAEGTVKAVSNTIEISVENLAAAQELYDTIELTDENGSVAFTPVYDASKKICSLVLGANMANGGSYTLKVLGKEYSFVIDYGQTAYVSKVALKPFLGNDELKNLDNVGANTPLKAEATVINPVGQSGSYSIVVVCYDGNEMISARTKTLAFDESKLISAGNLAFAAPAAEKLSIKAYAYNNIADLNPLTAGISLGAEEEEEVGYNIFTVTADGGISGENAVLCLFAPDKSAADIPVSAAVSDVTGTIVFLQQKKIADDGTAKFIIKLNENKASGAYAGYLRMGNTKAAERIVFVNKDENRTALTALKTSENVAADAKQYSDSLGFGKLAEIVPDSAYRIFADYYSNRAIDENDYEGNLSVVHQSEILACLNAGYISNIFEYKDIMADAFSDIEKYASKSYFTGTFQKTLTEAIKSKQTESLDRLKADINECFVLNLVYEPNGYKNITDVLADFAEEIGIASASAVDAVSIKISGKLYGSYSQLKKAIDDAMSQPASKPAGSGGSGGSKSSSKPVQIVANIDPDKGAAVQEIPKTIYRDMSEDHWASNAVVSLTEKGVLSGKGGDCFDPDASVTREEFTKMIMAAFYAEEELNAGEIPFADAVKDAWYYKYLAGAYERKLISGYNDTQFGVGAKISRQDAAVILNRVATANNYNFSVPSNIIRFNDDNEIAEYASDDVYTLKDAGVVSGDGGNFRPGSYMTRAEAAVIIYNMLSM